MPVCPAEATPLYGPRSASNPLKEIVEDWVEELFRLSFPAGVTHFPVTRTPTVPVGSKSKNLGVTPAPHASILAQRCNLGLTQRTRIAVARSERP